MEYSNDKQERIHLVIENLCSKSDDAFSLKNAELIQIAKKQKWYDQDDFTGYKVDFIQIFELTGQTDLFIIVPWSGKVQLPYEIIGIGKGNLPQPVAYTKKKWLTNENNWNQNLLNSINNIKLNKIFKWEWEPESFNLKHQLEWGIQSMPLKENKFLLLVKNTPDNSIPIDTFLDVKNNFEIILEKINFRGENSESFVFPCNSTIIIHKYENSVLNLIPDNNYLKDVNLVTELDYEEALNKLVEIAKSKFETDSESEEINQNLIHNVFTENQEILNQLIAHKMFWQGKSNVEKISKQVTNDFMDKLDMSLSGLDESSAQKLGCTIMSLFLGAIAIPVVLYFVLPKSIETGLRIVICVALLGLLIFGAIKLKNIVTLKYTNKNENK